VMGERVTLSGAPSRLRFTRKAATLAEVLTTLDLSCEDKPRGGSGTVHGHVAQAELLKLQKSGQFPDEPVRIILSAAASFSDLSISLG
jgi:hypothetical protein